MAGVIVVERERERERESSGGSEGIEGRWRRKKRERW